MNKALSGLRIFSYNASPPLLPMAEKGQGDGCLEVGMPCRCRVTSGGHFCTKLVTMGGSTATYLGATGLFYD